MVFLWPCSMAITISTVFLWYFYGFYGHFPSQVPPLSAIGSSSTAPSPKVRSLHPGDPGRPDGDPVMVGHLSTSTSTGDVLMANFNYHYGWHEERRCCFFMGMLNISYKIRHGKYRWARVDGAPLFHRRSAGSAIGHHPIVVAVYFVSNHQPHQRSSMFDPISLITLW